MFTEDGPRGKRFQGAGQARGNQPSSGSGLSSRPQDSSKAQRDPRLGLVTGAEAPQTLTGSPSARGSDCASTPSLCPSLPSGEGCKELLAGQGAGSPPSCTERHRGDVPRSDKGRMNPGRGRDPRWGTATPPLPRTSFPRPPNSPPLGTFPSGHIPGLTPTTGAPLFIPNPHCPRGHPRPPPAPAGTSPAI